MARSRLIKREKWTDPDATHPCIWVYPLDASAGEWPCWIEHEEGGDHDNLPGVHSLAELIGRATAHRAARIVVSERVYAAMVARGAAPAERPSEIMVCD
jgi:hypothetical protein